MKKFLASLTIVGILANGVGCQGCGNSTFFDTVYTYEWAQIKLTDGTIVEGEVDQWCDYDGEQLQITIDGQTYLVHSLNCTMFVKKPEE